MLQVDEVQLPSGFLADFKVQAAFGIQRQPHSTLRCRYFEKKNVSMVVRLLFTADQLMRKGIVIIKEI